MYCLCFMSLFLCVSRQGSAIFNGDVYNWPGLNLQDIYRECANVPASVAMFVISTVSHITHGVCRYRLWIMVWQAWTSYVAAAHFKHAQRRQGEKLLCARLQGWAWGGWQRYVAYRRKKKEKTASAKQWHLGNIKRYGCVSFTINWCLKLGMLPQSGMAKKRKRKYALNTRVINRNV